MPQNIVDVETIKNREGKMKRAKSVWPILMGAMLIAVLVLSACGTPAPTAAPTTAPPEEEPTAAPTEEPTAVPTEAPAVPEGSLTVALSTLEAETFLPWNGGGGRTPYLELIYEYLVYLDPETEEPTPGLATSWEMSDDGMSWTFEIREGVPFHEGWGEEIGRAHV